jgi:signal transduction histidine kinase
MFMNPRTGAELARQRQEEMRTQAGRQRLARRLHATPGTAPSWQRLRGALRSAARLRPAPGT